MLKTVAFGFDGSAPTRQFWELLGWRVVEGPGLSQPVIQSVFSQTNAVIPGKSSDLPCLGCKFLKVGIAFQDVLRRCTSLVSTG